MTLRDVLDSLPALILNTKHPDRVGHCTIRPARSGTWTISYAWVDEDAYGPVVQSDNLEDAAREMMDRLQTGPYSLSGQKPIQKLNLN